MACAAVRCCALLLCCAVPWRAGAYLTSSLSASLVVANDGGAAAAAAAAAALPLALLCAGAAWLLRLADAATDADADA